MVPAECSLDEDELREQLGRYRRVGESSTVRARESRRLVIAVGHEVPDALVDRLVEVERTCCPFFELVWHPRVRELSISVDQAAHERRLAGLAAALAAA